MIARLRAILPVWTDELSLRDRTTSNSVICPRDRATAGWRNILPRVLSADLAMLGNVASGTAASVDTGSSDAAADNVAPDNAVSDSAAPGNAAPGNAVSSNAVLSVPAVA